MKKNKLVIILIIIIFILLSYIMYDKLFSNNVKKINKEEEITLIDNINLDYLNIYLLSNKEAYLQVKNTSELDLEGRENLKSRLDTLYNRGFYYDIYVGNDKLKGFKVILDDGIEKMKKITINDYDYIVFIKENKRVGLFKYREYYDLLNTLVYDNYNDYKNVKDIKDNKIIYLDGSSEELVVND